MIHSILEIKSLMLLVHIGKDNSERCQKQKVSFSLKIAFLKNPLSENNSLKVCYQQICCHIQNFIKDKQFIFIEQLATSVLQELTLKLPSTVKINLCVQKIHPPVDNLKGGVSYSCGDLF